MAEHRCEHRTTGWTIALPPRPWQRTLERGEFSMNMRWAWTLPLLSSLAVTLAASPSIAQSPYGPGQMTSYPSPSPQRPYGPVQPMPLYAPPGAMPGYGQGGMGGMPGGMMPGGMPGGMP